MELAAALGLDPTQLEKGEEEQSPTEDDDVLDSLLGLGSPVPAVIKPKATRQEKSSESINETRNLESSFDKIDPVKATPPQKEKEKEEEDTSDYLSSLLSSSGRSSRRRPRRGESPSTSRGSTVETKSKAKADKAKAAAAAITFDSDEDEIIVPKVDKAKAAAAAITFDSDEDEQLPPPKSIQPKPVVTKPFVHSDEDIIKVTRKVEETRSEAVEVSTSQKSMSKSEKIEIKTEEKSQKAPWLSETTSNSRRGRRNRPPVAPQVESDDDFDLGLVPVVDSPPKARESSRSPTRPPYRPSSPSHVVLEAQVEEKETIIRTMKRQQESVEAQSSSVGRKHQAEIDALRSEYESNIKRERVLYESKIEDLKLSKEQVQNSLQKVNASLAVAKQRLKDEQELFHKREQHSEDRFKERFNQQTQLHQQELETERQSHEQIVESMRRSHSSEIEALRNRQKDKSDLQLVVSEIRTTADSIQSLQHQVAVQRSAHDKERLYEQESRVKLLVDMEDSCKKYTLRAQDECGRLRGLLTVVENTVRAIQGQASEEKERMRLEHARLTELSSTLQIEMKILRESVDKEQENLNKQKAEMESEKRQTEMRLNKRSEAIDAARRALDAERLSLSMDQQEFKVQESAGFERLREAERQLKRDREKLRLAEETFNNKLRISSTEIDEMEQKRQEMATQSKILEDEKRNLTDMALRIQEMSETIAQKENKFQADKDAASISLEQTRAMKKMITAETARLETLKQELSIEQKKVESSRLHLAKERGNLAQQRFENNQSNQREDVRFRYQLQQHLQQQRELLEKDGILAVTPQHTPYRAPQVILPTDPSGLSNNFRKDLESWWTRGRYDCAEVSKAKYFVKSAPNPLKTTGRIPMRNPSAHRIKL